MWRSAGKGAVGHRAAPGVGRVADPAEHPQDAVGVGGLVEDVAEAGPQRRDGERHVGRHDQHQRDLRTLDVEHTCEPHGSVGIQPRAEHDHGGHLAHGTPQHLVRGGGQGRVDHGLHLARKAALDGLTKPRVVLGITGDQQDAAHSKTPLVAPLSFSSASSGSSESQMRPNSEA